VSRALQFREGLCSNFAEGRGSNFAEGLCRRVHGSSGRGRGSSFERSPRSREQFRAVTEVFRAVTVCMLWFSVILRLQLRLFVVLQLCCMDILRLLYIAYAVCCMLIYSVFYFSYRENVISRMLYVVCYIRLRFHIKNSICI
jgi:hypothetical protein